MPTRYLACDLGAESGRLMLGTLAGGHLTLELLHRFPNAPVRRDGSLCWDIPGLFVELKRGLRLAAGRQFSYASISADSWGVDYVLFDAAANLMEPAFHYRDARTARSVASVKSALPSEIVFAETGIQSLAVNTIFQLAAETPQRLARATRMLMIADAFNFWLSGTAVVEESNASTTQLYNPLSRSWSKPLLEALHLPAKLFPPVVPSGTRLGALKKDIAQESGLPEIEVIASCSHDTGAAVAAIPAAAGHWAYLSSGTWSLMGVEEPLPLMNESCRELNFTNEIGYGRSVRLLKNIVGLWVVQECRRAWSATGKEYDYATLTRLAAAAPAFVSLIHPADPRFLAPDNMPEKISAFCHETAQPVPETPGAVIRCVLESMALLYRRTLQQIEQLLNRRLERLHIVGGGSQNHLLNQFTANALEIPVLAGPVEATALGNVLVQALTLGEFQSIEQARQCVRASFPLTTINPQPSELRVWREAYGRFAALFGH